MNRKRFLGGIALLVSVSIAGIWGIVHVLFKSPGESAFWQADAQLAPPLGVAAGNNVMAIHKAENFNEGLEQLGKQAEQGQAQDPAAPPDPKKVSSYFQLQKNGACVLVRVGHLEEYGEDLWGPILLQTWAMAQQNLEAANGGAPYELRLALRGDKGYLGTATGQARGVPHSVTGRISLKDQLFECFAAPPAPAVATAARAYRGADFH